MCISLGIDDCKYAHLRHDVNMLHTEAMMPNFANICRYPYKSIKCMRIHTIIHRCSPGTTHHGFWNSSLSFFEKHQPLIVGHPQHVKRCERNTMSGQYQEYR